MWYVLDLMVLLIIFYFVIASAKRGFARSFVELVGFILSIYIAFFVGNTVSAALYEKTIKPAVVNTVTQSVESNASSSVNDTVNSIWEGMPKAIKNASGYFGVSKETVSNNINAQISENVNVEQIADTTVDKVVKPVAIPLVKSVIGIVLFTVLMFAVKILARIINKMFKLPLIGGLNSFLGGVIGLGKGLVISIAVCITIGTLVALTGKEIWIFTKENIDKTYIFGLLANLKFF